jgi:hypothetical protein
VTGLQLISLFIATNFETDLKMLCGKFSLYFGFYLRLWEESVYIFFFLSFYFRCKLCSEPNLNQTLTSSQLDKSWFLKKQEKVNTIQSPSCVFLTFIPIFACLVCFPSIPKNEIEHFYFKCFENKTIQELEIQLQQDKDQFSMN